jgi:hypothetical protein
MNVCAMRISISISLGVPEPRGKGWKSKDKERRGQGKVGRGGFSRAEIFADKVKVPEGSE